MLITAGCVGGDQKSSDTRTLHTINVPEIVNNSQQEPQQTNSQIENDELFLLKVVIYLYEIDLETNQISKSSELHDNKTMSDWSHKLSVTSSQGINEVTAIQVSPALQPIKDEFLSALSDFKKAGEYTVTGVEYFNRGQTPFAESTLKQAAAYLDSGNVKLDTFIQHTQSYSDTFERPSISSTQTVPTPYVDPFPDALPINSAYHIENSLRDLRNSSFSNQDQSSLTKNDVSLKVKKAVLWDSYTIQAPTSYQTIGPSANKKYVIITVEAMNYAGNDIITTPNPSDFELIYNNFNYLPMDLKYSIQAAGNSYKSEQIARNEKSGGVLVYEVPSSLTINQTFVQFIYREEEKNPVWRLQ
jgi:hypothetical protein